MTGIVSYVLSKSFTKKSLAGVGALKGTPCKIKSVVPTYSPLDPNVPIINTITLEWDSNMNPAGAPIYHEESIEQIDNGRNIYKIVYRPDLSTAAILKYEIQFYDGTTDLFDIPATSGSMKKKVVLVLPTADVADHNTIYLTQVDGKPGVYSQWLTVENEAGVWEWLSLGSTEVNMDGYQKKIDTDISRDYKNFDIATKGAQPNVPNVVGAINEHDAEIGGHYDYSNNTVAELTTMHKNNIVSAVNEIGDLRNLESWNNATQTPATLVDAINLASKDYKIEEDTAGIPYTTTTDHQYTLYRTDDPLAPSGKVSDGEVVIPRITVEKRVDHISSTNPNYATYDLKAKGVEYNANDPTHKPYGRIDIPHLELSKIDPPVENVIDAIVMENWAVSPTGEITWTGQLHFNPTTNTYTVASIEPSYPVSITYFDKDTRTVKAKLNQAGVPSVPITVKLKYVAENVSLASQYYLSYNGDGYDSVISGCTIDIAKEMLLNDVEVLVCETDDVPVIGYKVGDKYIDMSFLLKDGSLKHAYILCKELFDPYEGDKAIKIEYDRDDKKNYVRLMIQDPYDIDCLKQDAHGLYLMKATVTQSGAVKLAGEDLAKLAANTDTAMTPADVLTFIKRSNAPGYVGFTSFNDTTYAAINELATTKVSLGEGAEIDPKDISTYKLTRTEVADADGHYRLVTKGELIHDKKTIFQVEKLSDAVDAQEYELYRLSKLDSTSVPNTIFQPGLYMKKDGSWIPCSADAIKPVKVLPPDDEIDYHALYEITRISVILDDGYCVLTESAIEAGWQCTTQGLVDVSGMVHGWDDVSEHWGDYWSLNIVRVIEPGEEQEPYIIAYRYTDEPSTVTHVKYRYIPEQGTLYYYFKSSDEAIEPSHWIQISDRFEGKYFDCDLNTLVNVDANEFKRQKMEDRGKTWVVQEDGTWDLGAAGGLEIVDELPTYEDATYGIQYYLTKNWKNEEDGKWYDVGVYYLEEIAPVPPETDPTYQWITVAHPNHNGYTAINKIEDYLYSAYYDELDFDYAKSYSVEEDFGGCTCFVKNGKMYRNYDWEIDDLADFVIHTPSTADGKHGVIGAAAALKGLTKDVVESKIYSPLYKVIPFRLLDGINDAGVAMAVLVVPFDPATDTPTTETNPGSEKISASFAVRYILDRANSAAEAANIFTNTNWYVSDNAHAKGFEMHFFVSDQTTTYCLYFKDNTAYAHILGDTSYPYTSVWTQKIMSNFKLNDDIILAANNRPLWTPYNRSSASYTNTGLEKYSSGLERYNAAYEMIHDDSFVTNMNDFAKYVRYETGAYMNSLPNEYKHASDLVGVYGLTNFSSWDDFATGLTTVATSFASHERNGVFWQTVHTAVYDFVNKSVKIYGQEELHPQTALEGTEFNFKFPVIDGRWVQRVENIEDAIPDDKSIVIETSSKKLFFQNNYGEWESINPFEEIDYIEYNYKRSNGLLKEGVVYIIKYPDDD